MNDFNFIAPFYDWLARTMLGNAVESSQSYYLREVLPNDEILILGGGAGKVLSEIPKCKSVTFLDKSSKMIRLAQKKESKNAVYFLENDFLAFESLSMFDVILCPFFLDCFGKKDLIKVLGKIRNLLKKNGRLIVVDFDSQRTSKSLLFLMISFFRVFAKLQARRLLNLKCIMEHYSWVKIDETKFDRGIFSAKYKLGS